MGRSILIALAGLLAAPLAAAVEFHVAPTGDDAHPGSMERPFLTLEQARDAARTAKGSTIRLAPGTWRLKRTFELDVRDSGTHFIGGGKARITGGIEVPAHAVRPVEDAAVLARLQPDVRGRLLEVDLRSLGVTDFGAMGPRGFGRAYIPAPVELLVDDEPLTLSRWPKGKEGEPMGAVIDPGAARQVGNVPPHGGSFAFTGDRPLRWKDATDTWITGFFMHGYADDTLQVKAFDLERKTITTVQAHGYGFGTGKPWNRWTALNLLEEIEKPGEYMADPKAGKIYFLPPAGRSATSRMEASVLKEPLVAIEGATDVVFDGVDFECSRGMGVYIERGSGNRIRNATLRNLGIVAVCIGQGVTGDTGTPARPMSRELGAYHGHLYGHATWDRQGGTGHRVEHCRIYNTGSGGVSLGGGDRLKLVPAGNVVEDCDIHHFNRWDRTYRTAVNIDGVGNVVRHCAIHDCPGSAFLLHGNDHVIEYNEIHHAMLDGDDMAAFYMGRDPSERGNIIRFNYWHDLARSLGTHAIYLDDVGGDGTRIQGNVFVRAGNLDTIFINGGSDVTMEDNLFVSCVSALRVNGKDGNMRWLTQTGRFESLLKAIRYNEPPWSEHYPEFRDYLAVTRTLPRNRIFRRNLLVDTRLAAATYSTYDASGNWSTTGDPGFVDAAAGNHDLKPGSEAFQRIPGFAPGMTSRMGLLKDGRPGTVERTEKRP